MMDFYDNVYYPVRAFMNGEDPYNAEQFTARYPVAFPYALHAPINLLLHVPFGLLSLRAAGIAYFVLSALLVLALAYMVLRLANVPPDGAKVFFLAGMILLTRAGHWNLVLGQRGIFLTLATCMALLYARDAPYLSGFALALSMVKPTWGVPLALLMVPCGYGRAVTIGIVLSALVNIPVFGLLAAKEGGLSSFGNVLLAGHEAWETMPGYDPATSYARVDLAATVSRFLGYSLSQLEQAVLTVAILLSAALVLRVLARQANSGSRNLSVGIICLGMLLAGYHNGYDVVLLIAPFVAVVVHGLPEQWGGVAFRRTLIWLFAIPALNWVASDSVLTAWRPSHGLWLLVTSVNGVCVTALFSGYLTLGLMRLRSSSAESSPLFATPPTTDR
jgi:Glycosyltransferase family 87